MGRTAPPVSLIPLFVRNGDVPEGMRGGCSQQSDFHECCLANRQLVNTPSHLKDLSSKRNCTKSISVK
jgi:hypothetical protein